MMFRYGVGFGPAALAWSLLGLLLVVALVVLIVWAVLRSTRGMSSSSPYRADALEILRMRFARGEITEAEFVQAKKVLGYER
jgi:putative membrane protein